VGDIDGDSDFDVITANSSSNSVSVLQNNGDGTLGRNSEYAVKLAPFSVATGDVNRDGFQDAVVAGFGLAYGFDSDYYSVLLGDGEGNFTVTDYEVAVGSDFVALEDLNGDENLDMVTTSAALNRVATGEWRWQFCA
jgi:hypothetical protein